MKQQTNILSPAKVHLWGADSLLGHWRQHCGTTSSIHAQTVLSKLVSGVGPSEWQSWAGRQRDSVRGAWGRGVLAGPKDVTLWCGEAERQHTHFSRQPIRRGVKRGQPTLWNLETDVSETTWKEARQRALEWRLVETYRWRVWMDSYSTIRKKKEKQIWFLVGLY